MHVDINKAKQLYQELKDKYSLFPRSTLDLQRKTSPIIMYIKGRSSPWKRARSIGR